jgi:hypothetical protein
VWFAVKKSAMPVPPRNIKESALQELAVKILSHKDWWLFPSQGLVNGFMGTDPIFIVGDQPSTHPWPPEHPNRKAFYSTLRKAGLANAHLTDLYKKRGVSNSLERELPHDFQIHLNLFRKEIEILQPKLIVALGQLAQKLLIQNLKEWQPAIPRIWHFSYVVRAGKESQYEANMRAIIWGNEHL